MLHAALREENVPLQQEEKRKNSSESICTEYYFPPISIFQFFPFPFGRWVRAASVATASLSRRYQILPQPSALQTVCWSGPADERGRRSDTSQVLPEATSPPACLRSHKPPRAAKAYLIKAEICIPRCRNEGVAGRAVLRCFLPWMVECVAPV